MGKLRKIKDKIKENPELWIYHRYGIIFAKHVWFWRRNHKRLNDKNRITPDDYGTESYRAYVRHILRRLGYPVVK